MLDTLVSIHDVMPSSMAPVGELLQLCEANRVSRVTLLVVPGLDWRPPQLQQLAAWESQGYELAGHGWVHQCRDICSWPHRLHSLVLSRDVAEHLSLAREEAYQLVSRCAAWFSDQGLAQPALYVPPAWALGRLTRNDMQTLPFRMFESLWRLHVPSEDTEPWLPLVGFEADTMTRQLLLRIANRLAIQAARLSRRPLRISIHPLDHRLRLANDLTRVLAMEMQPRLYRELSFDA